MRNVFLGVFLALVAHDGRLRGQSREPLEPAPLPPELHDTTPALSMEWTPLRWSRPKVVRASDGVGKALRLGPLKLELSVKEE